MTVTSTEHILGDAPSLGLPLYLTHTDAILRYTWVGLCLGFRYTIDALQLKEAVKHLLRDYSCLAGR